MKIRSSSPSLNDYFELNNFIKSAIFEIYSKTGSLINFLLAFLSFGDQGSINLCELLTFLSFCLQSSKES